jgi:hypothetical protein
MTSSRFKDFGSAEVVMEPLSFKLYDEDFHCKTSLQGKVLLDMVAAATSQDAGDAAQLVSGFFSKALMPESYERFKVLLESEKIVTVELMGEITSWLVEQYSGRPSEGPTDSLSGQ